VEFGIGRIKPQSLFVVVDGSLGITGAQVCGRPLIKFSDRRGIRVSRVQLRRVGRGLSGCANCACHGHDHIQVPQPSTIVLYSHPVHPTEIRVAGACRLLGLLAPEDRHGKHQCTARQRASLPESRQKTVAGVSTSPLPGHARHGIKKVNCERRPRAASEVQLQCELQLTRCVGRVRHRAEVRGFET